jgi:hypothetical protein
MLLFVAGRVVAVGWPVRPAGVRGAFGRLGWAALVALALAASSGCAPGEPPLSHGGSVRDHVSFVDGLRAAGFGVEPVGPVRQPFLRASGTVLRLSGGGLAQPAELESYNYDDADLGTDGRRVAEADARTIGPDGSPPGGVAAWPGPRSVFARERLLVVYLGSDPALRRVLAELIGPQIAGR